MKPTGSTEQGIGDRNTDNFSIPRQTRTAEILYAESILLRTNYCGSGEYIMELDVELHGKISEHPEYPS